MQEHSMSKTIWAIVVLFIIGAIAAFFSVDMNSYRSEEQRGAGMQTEVDLPNNL